MRNGINSEKTTHELMPEWAFAIPDAENTVRIMQEAPCLIAVLNTNQHTPFASIENEKRIVEICDSLSIGAAIENMILTRSEEHTSELQSLSRISYAVFCLKIRSEERRVGKECRL